MEGLESPRGNGEALMHFDAESDGGNVFIDYLRPKVYFYTEEPPLRSTTFPQEWFETMSREISEEVQPKEPPFFTVSVTWPTSLYCSLIL